MIELAYETPPVWAERALAAPLELLSDHAHCELRAAASAQMLIVRNTGRARLVERLAALAMEEMSHFRQVTALLHELGGRLLPAEPNPYMKGLLSASADTREESLLDRLLVAALIERRSLERFELLADTADERIAPLYADLGPSEAGHGILFVDLARGCYPEGVVSRRLGELAALEGAVVERLPFAARIHSGLA